MAIEEVKVELPEIDGEELQTDVDESLAQTNEDEVPAENSDQFNEENLIEEAPAVVEEKPVVKTSRFQERIDQLTEQKKSAEARAYSAGVQYQTLKHSLDQLTEPVPESYDDYKEFVRDMAKFVSAQQRVADKEAELITAATILKNHSSDSEQARMKAGLESYADFGDKAFELGKYLQPGTAAYEALFDSDQFVEVAYYLANNPNEAIRIAGLPARQQTREILKIETKFEGGVTPTPTVVSQRLPAAAKGKVSAAPAPARQVLSGKGGGISEANPAKESMEAYAARRQKEFNRR